MKEFDAVNILGIRINTLPVEAIVDFINRSIIRDEKVILAYANIHAFNLTEKHPWFRGFLNNAAITYCDGFGLKWGACLLGLKIPYRYTPPDWFPMLAMSCVQHDYSLFFLGARAGVAQKAASTLQKEFPGLNVKGTHHGYFDKTKGSIENQKIISLINSSQPDILVVGFGMPLQERWLMENWSAIEAKVGLPVGAFLDYTAGEIQRAPRWMTDHGLEWLGRMIFEPGRLWHRYLVGNPKFFFRILKQRFRAS